MATHSTYTESDFKNLQGEYVVLYKGHIWHAWLSHEIGTIVSGGANIQEIHVYPVLAGIQSITWIGINSESEVCIPLWHYVK